MQWAKAEGGDVSEPPAGVKPIHEIDEVTPPALDVEELRMSQDKSS